MSIILRNLHKTQICNSPFSIRAKQTTTTLNGVPRRVCKHYYRSFDCSAYQDRYDSGGPLYPTFPYGHVGMTSPTHAPRRVCRSQLDQLAQEVLHDVHQSIVPHHYEYARVLSRHFDVVSKHSGGLPVCHSRP